MRKGVGREEVANKDYKRDSLTSGRVGPGSSKDWTVQSPEQAREIATMARIPNVVELGASRDVPIFMVILLEEKHSAIAGQARS
jgi:hypothetical protein